MISPESHILTPGRPAKLEDGLNLWTVAAEEWGWIHWQQDPRRFGLYDSGTFHLTEGAISRLVRGELTVV